MAVFAAAAGFVLVLLASTAHAQWTYGRATKYGNDGGATIDQGSCMFGHLDPNSGTGQDIAAMIDSDPNYAGSCGRCYEIQCRNAAFSDGYGQKIDRTGVCYDESRSVIVRITDTCPCYYPDNAYSNKRWCCGDMPHMDLSYHAFQKLADEKWGVMGIRYRQVSCPSGTPGNTPLQKSRNVAPSFKGQAFQ